jgi:hypothetical protein
MKPIPENRMDEFEDVSMDSVKQLKAFFTYQGTDSRYFQKARLATGMISAYARLRSSETNRMAVEQVSGRFALNQAPQKKLKG